MHGDEDDEIDRLRTMFAHARETRVPSRSVVQRVLTLIRTWLKRKATAAPIKNKKEKDAA
jgi:hypothetical protein